MASIIVMPRWMLRTTLFLLCHVAPTTCPDKADVPQPRSERERDLPSRPPQRIPVLYNEKRLPSRFRLLSNRHFAPAC